MNNETNISRREFILRTAKAVACTGAAGAAGYLLLDKTGPKASSGPSSLSVSKLDFSVPAIQGKTMSIVSGSERRAGIIKAINLLGGMERFIKKGDRVLIKPNAAFATSPFLGATTNPDMIAAVIEMCYTAGAKEVLVTDNPINDAQSCFTLSGIGKAASAKRATVILPKSSYFKAITLESGKLIRNWPVLYEPLKGVNKVIGIVPVKDHNRSGASMSMKGWYGLLGGRRNVFHQDINTIIAELAVLIRPTLVILDGIEVMITNGPTGGSTSDLRKANTIIAGCDPVAADAFGATLLDLEPGKLRYLQMAQDMGVGTVDWKSVKPIRATI